jgi:hypothetical protein
MLVICGATIVAGIGRIRTSTADGPATVGPLTTRPSLSRSAAPSFTAPVQVVDGGPKTSFDLPVGTGVRFSDHDGTWTVALLGVEWIDECEDVLGSTAAAVLFDISYEVVQGAVSIVPLNDFAYVLPNGTTLRADLLSTCAEPPLDYTIISAGEERRGRIAIQLPAGSSRGSGTLTYGQIGVPTASWKVTDGSGG